MGERKLLSLQHIYKRFNSVEVLHDVSFEVGPHSVMGLVGENGSGKSTAMNILGGVVRPTRGTMTFDGETHAPETPRDATRSGIAFVHQELNLFANLSIEDNIFIDSFPRWSKWTPTINRSDVRRQSRALLDQIGLKQPSTTKLSQLSQGERQMVEIAKGLRSKAKLMIFDEPTTSLTRHECERLFGIIRHLRDQGMGVIYISHILDDILSLTDQVVVLRDGHVTAKEETSRVSVGELVHHMVGRDIKQLYPERPALDGSAQDAGQSPVSLLDVQQLTKEGFCNSINLSIQAGEILGLSGLMGSGRTELARMLFGLDDFDSGTVTVEGKKLLSMTPSACARAGIAFVTEDRRQEGLFIDAKIRPNVAAASLRDYATPIMGVLNRRRLREHADRTASESGLERESPWGKLVRNLSGGNQQKVVLAKWMMRSPRVLILDEPTRGIDIGAKHEIYEAIAKLAEAGSAVLFISSELEELIGMCDRIAVMQRGEISAQFTRSEFDTKRLMDAAIWNREEVT